MSSANVSFVYNPHLLTTILNYGDARAGVQSPTLAAPGHRASIHQGSSMMNRSQQRLSAILVTAAGALAPIVGVHAGPEHGIAMHGSPKYAAGFTHLDYANPDAPQGGTLRLAAVGTYDSLNPHIVKARRPPA